ncbi:MAG: threonine ammonia-lyase, partial [Rhabdochlamydiaceae bacterium]
IRSLGAKTVFFGRQQDERVRKANEIQEAEGQAFIQPFNDLEIITGQATCGMELLEDDPDVESIFVPIGGGGLISGIACAVRLLQKPRRHVKVIGVQSEGSPSMYESFVNHKLSSIGESKTIADGLAVRKPGEITFSIVSRFVDDIMLVSDEEIISATSRLLRKEHVLSEPSGAAAFAGLLKMRRQSGKGEKEKSAAIVSGGNISSEALAQVAIATT